VVKNQERFTQTEYKSLIIKSIICGAFVLFASNPAMADEVLTGNNLVQSLSGKSLSCVADGSPMSLTFSVANKKGHVSYSGQWKGKKFNSQYRLTKKGTYTNRGKARTVSRASNGQIILAGSGVPKAFCDLN
jgi:hypothetical protein